MIWTSIALRIGHNLSIGSIDIILADCDRLILDAKNLHHTIAKVERLLNRARHAAFHIWRHYETVDNNLDVVTQILIEFRPFVERIDDAVNTSTRKTFCRILLANMRERALLLDDNRRENHELTSDRPLHHLFDDVLRRTTSHFGVANRTMRHTDACEQQAKIIVDFRHSRNRRTRVTRSRFLINRNSRGETSNHIDIRLIHHTEEHARIRRKRLDIAALAFSINRIKS